MTKWTDVEEIVHILEESWNTILLEKIVNSSEEQMLEIIESFKEELWQKSYIDLDTSGWTATDYQRLRDVSESQIILILEDE